VFAGALQAIGRDLGTVEGRRRAVGHLAATGGLLAGSAPAYDSVRLGLGLYGVLPEGLTPAPEMRPAAAALRPVMSLHARPVRVADLPAGHGVSYGPSFETGRPSRIATLPVGYGDGWPRALSNRAQALVRGRRVPLVGTVAMDAVMADVTDVPGAPVGMDDEFVLLGEQVGPDGTEAITAGELALSRTTISWEVLTAMSRRLPRVYHAAAVPVGLRTLTEEVHPWLPTSSSGTETSATSRSTRS
jgi:alanine racemase